MITGGHPLAGKASPTAIPAVPGNAENDSKIHDKIKSTRP